MRKTCSNCGTKDPSVSYRRVECDGIGYGALLDVTCWIDANRAQALAVGAAVVVGSGARR